MTTFAKKLTEKSIKIKIEPFTAINSVYSDYTPVLSADGTQFYFTSKRKGNTGGEKDNFGEYYDDIYSSQYDLNKWSKPKKMGFKINTGNSEILGCISSDGNQFYFSRQMRETYDIYVSNLSKKNKWTVPQKLGQDINTKYNELYAFITSDGNTMLFASDKPGGYGGYDIYMSEKLATGEWGNPFNLGPEVNSQYDEICPMLMPDGTLYFSSKGHETMGGFDIFMTTISEDGLWTKPENLGYPLNTAYDDINFIFTSPDGKKGFYSSAKTGGYGESDIYEFTFE
jgi:Tol biopolymer transport system component